MKKYICEIGPGEGYPGGMLTVIKGYMNSKYLKEFRLKHIVTAAKKKKIIVFFQGMTYYFILCLFKKVQVSHIHMSERGSCTRAMFIININKLFGIPTIVHSHGSEIIEYYNSLDDIAKHKFDLKMRKADKVIVLTPGWKKFWGNIVDSNNIVVIPNFVKIPRIDKKYFLDGKLNILFLGYIGDRKGTYDLIKAIKLLVTQGKKDIILRIAGNGEINKCRKIVSENRLDEFIKVVGWADEGKKEKLFQKTDILVLPSHFESFGIVALEAMAHKIPVICGDKGFTKELITSEKDGYVAQTGNPKDIAKAISLVSNDVETLGEKGFSKVNQYFSEEKVTKKIADIYRELS